MNSIRKMASAIILTLFLSGAALASGFLNLTVSNHRTSITFNQQLFDVLNVSMNAGGSFQVRYQADQPVNALGFVNLNYTGSNWIISLEATTSKELSLSYGYYW